MKGTVRRAGAFAVVGSMALAAPLLGRAAVLPFVAVAAVAAVVDRGPIFELFARPRDRRQGRLRSLFDFALAATILGGLATVGDLPVPVFSGTILLVVVGNLGAEIVRVRTDAPTEAGFLAGGAVGAIVGTVTAAALAGIEVLPGELLLLTVTGALAGALLRSMLFPRDEPPLLLSIGLLLWFLTAAAAGVTPTEVAAALAITAVFGGISYALDAASLEGAMAGILLGFLVIVLGGYGWFAILLAFFGVGALSTKFRYDRKLDRGIAEDNDGARGGTKVLANSAVGLAGAVGFAAVDAGLVEGDGLLFLLLFSGAIATALGDTLSSEIGGTYDGARLVTTLEPVEPGTDGAVTWQGTLAALVGAGIVGGIAFALFPEVGVVGGVAIAVAGLAGMTADSVLGATIEGGQVGNETVNFLATLAGGLVGVGLGLALGIAGL